MAVTNQQVAELYVATFNRAPDAAGLSYWVNDSGLTIEEIAMSFFDQAETQALYPAGTTDAAFVTSIYTNLFNRTPDADGLAYWEAALSTGGMTRSVMIEAMKNGALGTDATIIANKATVGLSFAAAGLNDTTQATAVLANVTADASTVSTALGLVSDYSNPGSTLAFTTVATDVLVGTAGNDTISGVASAVGTTFQTGDLVTGGNGTDTLNITTSRDISAANANKATVTGVENVNISTQTAAAFAVDAANFTGVENMTINRDDLSGGLIDGTGAVTVNPVDAAKVAKITAGTQVNALTVTQATTAGITVDATGVTGNVAVTGSATITANDSTATVSVANLGTAAQDAKAVSIDAAAAATVTTGTLITGAVTVNAAAATTVTVSNASGGATVNAATSHATNATVAVEKIDASGANITVGTGVTGNTMTVQIGGSAGATDVATVAGAGAIALDVGHTVAAVDTVNLAATTAAATYTITSTNGGFTTLAASGATAVNVSTTGDLVDAKTVTGVNEFTVNAAATAATLDLTNVSANTLILSADNANDAITVASGANVKVTAATQTAGLNLIAATDGASLTLEAGDNTVTTAQSTTTLNAVLLNDTNDFATVAIVATGSRFTATSFDAADAAVTITGDENVTLGAAVAAGSIDASALTGAFSMTMNANSTTVTGGTGVDTITLNGAAVMTLDAGNGANVITVTTVSNGSTITTGNGADTINLTSTASYVVQGGEGNDTYNMNGDADVVIADAGGTSDSIVFAAGSVDFSNNTNFAFSGIETLDITAATVTTLSYEDLSGKTLTVTGNAAGDILVAAGTDTAVDTIDFSSLTVSGTATLKIDGGDKADTMTGSNSGTFFIINDGDVDAGEVITGGSGTDVLDGSGLSASVDLSVATITGVETLYNNLMSTTLGQGTGITAIANDAATALATKASLLVLVKSTTAFGAAAQGSAAAVDVAGEWYLTQDANTDATLGDNALTYFDEVSGQAVTVTLTGVAATNVATGTVVAGNLVIDMA